MFLIGRYRNDVGSCWYAREGLNEWQEHSEPWTSSERRVQAIKSNSLVSQATALSLTLSSLAAKNHHGLHRCILWFMPSHATPKTLPLYLQHSSSLQPERRPQAPTFIPSHFHGFFLHTFPLAFSHAPNPAPPPFPQHLYITHIKLKNVEQNR